MGDSKSRPVIGWTNYNTIAPNSELDGRPKKKSRRKMNGNMDMLKKFRYNFNYWLKNCYQSTESIEDAQSNPPPSTY
jgi:hypothetical protein